MASAIWTSNTTWGDYLSTGYTYSVEETPEEARERKKKLIKDIIDDDKYLLQELLTELRKEKIEQIKKNV